MLDAIVLLRDMSAKSDGRKAWGNIEAKEESAALESYREANTLMVSASIVNSEDYVMNMAKSLTDAIEAMNSTEGLESIIATVGNRLSQIRVILNKTLIARISILCSFYKTVS